jgi:outer membrane protein assembly factor BamB
MTTRSTLTDLKVTDPLLMDEIGVTPRRVTLIAASFLAIFALASARAQTPNAPVSPEGPASPTGPLATGTNAPGAPSAADWTTFGFDLQRTGYNPSETQLSASNVSSLKLHWSIDLGGAMVTQPTFLSGVTVGGASTDLVYVATLPGLVTALNAAIGKVVWQSQVPAVQPIGGDFGAGVVGVIGTPTIDRANNQMFVVSGTGQLHALDLATGAEQSGWPLPLLDAANGPPRMFVYGSPTLVGTSLYIATASNGDRRPYHGQVIEVSTTYRTVLNRWYPTGATGPDGGGIWGEGGVAATIFNPAAPTDYNLFAATGNAFATPQNAALAEHVVKLDPSLQVLASNTTPAPSGDADFGATPVLFQPPQCSTGRLVVMKKSGELFFYDTNAIDAGPLQTLQISVPSTEGDFIGLPAFDPVLNQVYLGNPTDSTSGPYKHGLIALSLSSDCSSLSLAWQTQVGKNESSFANPAIPPTVANGVVYYADGVASEVFAFDARTGRQLWTFATTAGSGIFASPSVANGQLFVAAWDHNLYAFGL